MTGIRSTAPLFEIHLLSGRKSTYYNCNLTPIAFTVLNSDTKLELAVKALISEEYHYLLDKTKDGKMLTREETEIIKKDIKKLIES
ncbi:hypothetical protein KKC65_03530 [Patescibacteria group bacterium]|nr:hypothetical protein [Patescibacteria group bacterium]